MIRVVVVDDHSPVREGMRSLLDATGDIKVVGTAGSTLEALQVVEDTFPDIALVDLQIPGVGGGLALTRELTDLHTHVLILTASDEDRFRYDALRAGAEGFISKEEDIQTVIDSLHDVAAGSDRMHLQLEDEVAGFDPLTPREVDVVACISRGLTNKEIARELNLSVRTMTTHAVNAYLRLGVQNRTGAIAEARRRGEIGRN